MTKIKKISPEDRRQDAAFDVVFVHGLGGDALTTWTLGGARSCWLDWLAEDYPQAMVWSLDFDAWSSGWRGRAMGLFERAIAILAVLENEGIGKRPLCFVAHSAGGL